MVVSPSLTTTGGCSRACQTIRPAHGMCHQVGEVFPRGSTQGCGARASTAAPRARSDGPNNNPIRTRVLPASETETDSPVAVLKRPGRAWIRRRELELRPHQPGIRGRRARGADANGLRPPGNPVPVPPGTTSRKRPVRPSVKNVSQPHSVDALGRGCGHCRRGRPGDCVRHRSRHDAAGRGRGHLPAAFWPRPLVGVEHGEGGVHAASGRSLCSASPSSLNRPHSRSSPKGGPGPAAVVGNIPPHGAPRSQAASGIDHLAERAIVASPSQSVRPSLVRQIEDECRSAGRRRNRRPYTPAVNVIEGARRNETGEREGAHRH